MEAALATLNRAQLPAKITATYALVQRLLAAKRDLRLEQELAALDRFQQSRDEMEVLFTFLAERYERRTVIITSNLVFSEWDRIFKDSMTTAAAIDRLVHHSVILEMAGKSIRFEDAQAELANQGGTAPSSTRTPPPLHPNPTPGSAPTAPGPTAATTSPSTTTTTDGASPTITTPSTASSTTTTTSIPGAAPTAPARQPRRQLPR
jgi:hypothetical protein